MAGENVYTCPYCDYKFLFPPTMDEYACPVCGGEVTRPKKEEG